MSKVTESAIRRARKVFVEAGGILRTKEVLEKGIQERTLYAMRDAGMLERLARGLYRLADLEPMSEPDLATIGAKLPQVVICMLSALDYHGLTTRIPHVIHVAVKQGSIAPRLEYPPLRLWWYSGDVYTSGIETHDIDGVGVKVYSAEKTLADCFKHRNKIGLEAVIEALRMYRDRGEMDIAALLRYAEICRVKTVMRPYLEATL